MKRISILLVLLTTINTLCFGQMEIKVQFVNTKSDSVKLQAFSDKHKLEDLYVLPYSNEVIFKSKTSLDPGIYWILQDTNLVDAFFISTTKNQKFSVKIDPEKGNVYTGSIENTHNQEYLKQIEVFNEQLVQLDNEFNQARAKLPQYMLQTFADSCTAKAKRINAAKEAYQRKVIAENPNTLLATIIQASIEMPQPPAEYYNNRMLYIKYYVEHFFDNFPWNDPRIFNTPVGDNKIKEFCNIIYQLDDPTLDTFVVAYIEKSHINNDSFYKFFDRVESILGSNVSPYKVEHTYIKMLQNALTYKNLEENHQRRWTRELQTINKNLDGSILPDFNIVMSNGDTTSFHKIESEYMILYLQHPTCPTCHEVRNRMANYPVLNTAIAKGRIKVLTVYFEDDAKVWSNFVTSRNANPNWLHSWNYDQSIEDQQLFDTRTIPFMFLVDKDKKVIRKDILVNEIEDYIKKLGINE